MEGICTTVNRNFSAGGTGHFDILQRFRDVYSRQPMDHVAKEIRLRVTSQDTVDPLHNEICESERRQRYYRALSSFKSAITHDADRK